jgi:hypothetical protein
VQPGRAVSILTQAEQQVRIHGVDAHLLPVTNADHVANGFQALNTWLCLTTALHHNPSAAAAATVSSCT